MEKNNNPQEIKVELSPEVAAGQYSNRAFISHGVGAPTTKGGIPNPFEA